MKRIAILILMFWIGFISFALIIDEPELLLIKFKLMFGGVLVATVMLAIDDFRNK